MKATAKEIMEYGRELNNIKTRLSNMAKKVLETKGEVIYIPFEFSYIVGKNTKKIESFANVVNHEFMELAKQLKETGGDAYVKDYMIACEKTGIKEEGKNFKMEFDPQFGRAVAKCDPEKVEQRLKDIEKVKTKHKKYLNEMASLDDKYRIRLDTEDEIELRMIKKSNLPKDLLLPEEVELLMEILEDADEVTANNKR